MLSEEEIEKAKERIWKSINDTWYSTIYSQEENEKDEQILLDYIEQLEQEKNDRICADKYENSIINKLQTREQKLIEELEEELTLDNLTVKANKIEKILHKDKINFIKEQAIRATNEYRKEILKILKGEKSRWIKN